MKARLINLMPWREWHQRARRRFWIRFWVFAGVSSLLLMMALHMGILLERQAAHLWLQSETVVSEGMAAREPQLQSLHKQWVQHESRLQRQQLTRNWQSRLVTLAQQIPDSAWLTSLQFRQGQLELVGLTYSLSVLNELEQILQALPGFHLRQSGSTERDAEGRWQFHYQLDKDTGDALGS
jgi:pilus assembly protein HofN